MVGREREEVYEPLRERDTGRRVLPGSYIYTSCSSHSCALLSAVGLADDSTFFSLDSIFMLVSLLLAPANDFQGERFGFFYSSLG